MVILERFRSFLPPTPPPTLCTTGLGNVIRKLPPAWWPSPSLLCEPYRMFRGTDSCANPHHSPVRNLIRKELVEPVRRPRLDSRINKNPKQGSGMRTSLTSSSAPWPKQSCTADSDKHMGSLGGLFVTFVEKPKFLHGPHPSRCLASRQVHQSLARHTSVHSTLRCRILGMTTITIAVSCRACLPVGR